MKAENKTVMTIESPERPTKVITIEEKEEDLNNYEDQEQVYSEPMMQ
jgi:hypothetical protein